MVNVDAIGPALRLGRRALRLGLEYIDGAIDEVTEPARSVERDREMPSAAHHRRDAVEALAVVRRKVGHIRFNSLAVTTRSGVERGREAIEDQLLSRPSGSSSLAMRSAFARSSLIEINVASGSTYANRSVIVSLSLCAAPGRNSAASPVNGFGAAMLITPTLTPAAWRPLRQRQRPDAAAAVFDKLCPDWRK